MAEVRLLRSLEMANRRHIDQFESAVMWGGLALLVYLVYLIVTPFLVPLGWATVLAVVAYPTHERLAIRWGPGRAAAISTLAVTVILIFPSVVLVVAFAREALQIGETLQRALAEGQVAWVERAISEFGQRLPFASNIDLPALATDAVRNSATFLVTRSGGALRNTAGFFLDLVIALFSTFFLLRDAPAIMKAIRRLLPMEDADREELITRTRNIISAVVTSSGLVAATQGLLGGIAFAIVGIEAPVFWGVLMAFLCLLPPGCRHHLASSLHSPRHERFDDPRSDSGGSRRRRGQHGRQRPTAHTAKRTSQDERAGDSDQPARRYRRVRRVGSGVGAGTRRHGPLVLEYLYQLAIGPHLDSPARIDDLMNDDPMISFCH